MKLFLLAEMLFFVVAAHILNTAKTDGNMGVGTLRNDLDLLQKEFRNQRRKWRKQLSSEIEQRKTERDKLQQEMNVMQTIVEEMKHECASIRRIPLNKITEVLSIEKRIRQQTQGDVEELKIEVKGYSAKISSLQSVVVNNNKTQTDSVSDLQAQIADMKCDPCMASLPGRKGNPGRRGETGEPEASGGSREPARSEENSTPTEPVLPNGLSVPVLRFTRAFADFPDRVVIEAEGTAVRDGPVRAILTNVRSDGVLPADQRHYWEIDCVWRVMRSRTGSYWSLVGAVGVRREGSDFRHSLGMDRQSWAVRILYGYGLKTWRFGCYRNGEYLFESEPVTPTSTDVSHRLGFLHNPTDRTLTVVDVNANTTLCSFQTPGAGSQPLVPVVWFAWNYFQRMFRLPPVDPSRIPGAVTDLLHI